MEKVRKPRNPVAICWGLVLRKARESRSWEYTDVARTSGISAEFYRNIEKANFNLHVSQAYPLYKTFRNDVIGETFTLDGIINILALISIMEAKANDKSKKGVNTDDPKEYLSRLIQCAGDLAEDSTKLKKLINGFFQADAFSLPEDGTSTIQKLEDSGLVFEMEDFLIHYDSYSSGISIKTHEDTKYIDNFFDEVPSVYTDILNETKRNLDALPVRMVFSELQKWELAKQSKIKELFVLIGDKFDVTQPKNLETYKYSYLFQETFERARFIVVNPNLTSDNIKEDFETNLKTAYENTEQKIPKDWDKGLKKIKFKVIRALPEDLKTILTVENRGSKEKYEVFWVFKFYDDSLVAFVANAVEGPNFKKDKIYTFVEGKSLFIKDIPKRFAIIKQ
ncbi:MAG: hypothetical protein AAB681_00455, partial [Patescibacteria group bacterium]